MEIKKIDLYKFRGKNSSLFTGRPQGESVRTELNLDDNDKNGNKIIFLIPSETSSINPSFYLGLLFESIKFHGYDKFEDYYTFEILDENQEVRKVLQSNLEDGKRNALNTILGKTGLKRFLK